MTNDEIPNDEWNDEYGTSLLRNLGRLRMAPSIFVVDFSSFVMSRGVPWY